MPIPLASVRRSELDPNMRHVLAARALAAARDQGSLGPRDVRQLLIEAGLPGEAWKEVLAPVRPQLRYHRGRYYPLSPLVVRLHESRQNQRVVQRAVRRLVGQYRHAQMQMVDRRRHARTPFFLPVTVHTADGRELRLCSCDVSPAGIRLIGIYNLHGQRVRVELPAADGEGPSASFALHILWAKPVADSLFENGGVFESVSLARNE